LREDESLRKCGARTRCGSLHRLHLLLSVSGLTATMVPSLCGSRSVASPAYSSSAPTPSRRSLDTPSRDSTASALAARRISPPMAMRRVQFVDAETDKRPRSQSASVLLATPVELAPRRNLKWQPPVRELAEEGGGSAAQIRKRVDSRWSVYTENVMRELST
jgi:hypothetical protein